MVKRALPLVVLLILLFPPSASAASCTVSVTNLAFGSYNVFNAAPVASTATITHQCTLNLVEILFPPTVTISISRGSSGTYAARTMRNGTEALAYNVYRDAAATQIWGDGSSGTSRYSAPAATNPPPLTVYGVVPARQDVTAGAYSDTLTVTIQF